MQNYKPFRKKYRRKSLGPRVEQRVLRQHRKHCPQKEKLTNWTLSKLRTCSAKVALGEDQKTNPRLGGGAGGKVCKPYI